MCDIAEAVEHVELFISTLQKLEVCGGNHLGDASLLQISDVTLRLCNIKVQKLVEQLRAIVAIEDEVLSDALDVTISGTSCPNHRRDHQDGFVGD